jgi:hypothetical protein
MKRALVIAAVGLAFASPARAGMIVVEEYGLADVASNHRGALVGKVLSSKPAGPRSLDVELLLIAVHPGGGVTQKAGDRATVRTYGGVEMTDPHRSVRDRRLRGHASKAIIGTLVVAVPTGHGLYALNDSAPMQVELRDVDEAMQRRLGVLFDAAKREAYPHEPVAVLRRDLADPDLAALAAPALERRGALDATSLAGASPGFLRARYEALDPAKRGALANDLAIAVETTPALRDGVAQLLFEAPRAETVPALAKLVASYDRRRPEDVETLERLRGEIASLDEAIGKKPLDLTPLAEFIAMEEVYRTSTRSDADTLAKLTRRMSAAARTRVAILLLENAYTTAAKPDDGPDGGLIEEALRLTREVPSASVLDALAKLDPSRPSILAQREETLGMMMDIALAVMKAQPATRTRARAIIEGWRSKNVAAEEGALKRWKHAR